MQYLLLALLALICLQSRWPVSPLGLGVAGSTSAMAMFVAGVWLLASGLAWSYCRLLVKHRDETPAIMRRFARWQKLHFRLLFLSFLGLLYLLGWGHAVKDGLGSLLPEIPGLEVLMIAPLLVCLVLSWLCFYDVERMAHRIAQLETPFLSRQAYLGLQTRVNLVLVIPPMFFMIVLQGLFYFFPQLGEDQQLISFTSMVFLGAAFVTIPFLLRCFLGLRPLPAGPLRDQLTAVCQRTGFRCSDFLVWNTRFAVANAMVTGVLPWARYIVLTDRLARELTIEELEAVVGHEIGHIKHHHMFFYMSFLLGSLMLLGVLAQAGEALLNQPEVRSYFSQRVPFITNLLDQYEYFAALPVLVVMCAYIFFVFGYLSRHCERQADLFGARTVSCQVFVNALEKVALLNGIKRDKADWLSWMHPTIARRVDFLMRAQEDPLLEPRFQRRLGLMKWGLTLGMATLLGVVVWLGVPIRVESSRSQLSHAAEINAE